MDKILIPRKQRAAAKRMLTDCDCMNRAVATIWNIEELHPSYDLHQVNDQWLTDYISRKMQLINADESLTEAERRTRLKAWQTIKDTAAPAIVTINGILEEWPSVEFVVVDDDADIPEYAPTTESMDAATAERATFTIPAEAKEHLRLIQDCKKTAQALRDWETAEDCKFFPLQALADMQDDALVEMWIDNAVRVDRRWKYITPPPRPNRLF